MTIKKRPMYFLILIVLLFSASVAYAADPVSTLLGMTPFKDWNIKQTYDDYYSFVDFVLFLIIFIGLTQVTLGKAFHGPGGRAVQIGLGIAFAVSLAYWETTQSPPWNIGRLGGMFAVVFLLIVGFSVFEMLKKTGEKASGAGALAFIVVYFGMKAMAPAPFDWLKKNIPFLDTILLIAALVAIVKTVTSFAQYVGGSNIGGVNFGNVDKAIAMSKSPIGGGKFTKKYLPETAEVMKERNLSDKIESLGKMEKNDVENTILNLQDLQALIATHSQDTATLHKIADRIRKIKWNERKTIRINKSQSRIEKHIEGLAEKVAAHLKSQNIPLDGGRVVQEATNIAKLEKYTAHFFNEFSNQEDVFIQHMRNLVNYLYATNAGDATRELHEAMTAKMTQLKIVDEYMKATANNLATLTQTLHQLSRLQNELPHDTNRATSLLEKIQGFMR